MAPALPTSAATPAFESVVYFDNFLGSRDMFLLTSVSVTSNPAVIPLSGTSHAVSEKWSRKGAVHNCFWSFNRS